MSFQVVHVVVAEPQGPPGPEGPMGPTGPPGPPGPPGSGEGADYFRHVQTTAATTWTIAHNLPFRPNVSVVDSAGSEIFPGDVKHISSTTVQLTFSAAVGGEAYLT